MDFNIIGRNVINSTTVFLVNQGTLPQQVIDGMMSLVLSSDGCKIETSRLEQFVRFTSESLITRHQTTEYFNKFKQLPDKMKMRLATETRIIDIVALNANDRQKYSGVPFIFPKPSLENWKDKRTCSFIFPIWKDKRPLK